MKDVAQLKQIRVFSSKTKAILRGHPWIFSGAIQSKDETLKDGDLVEVFDDKTRYLGFGYYQNNNISVKLLGFGNEHYSDNFWYIRISSAFDLRRSLGLLDNPNTNSYRLIHGEGDNLAGLIIDIYDDVAVIQCHSQGILNQINHIKNAIEQIYGMKIQHIYNKSQESLSKSASTPISNHFLKGGKENVQIVENGIRFEINIVESQKTGFFLDQRENRNLLKKYCVNRDVLNTFCYTGGFSLYALKANANSVVSIDSSSKAIQQLTINLQLNEIELQKHNSKTEEAIHYLGQMEKDLYDLIILDPPAFAKNVSKRHNAIQAYKRINVSAMKQIRKGGFIFSFSCSQVVTEELFYHTIISAGIESGRKIRILHKLHQAADHPVNLFHPEGSYLKGVVLEIN